MSKLRVSIDVELDEEDKEGREASRVLTTRDAVVILMIDGGEQMFEFTVSDLHVIDLVEQS